MEKIISGIYELLANIFILIAGIPNGIKSGGSGVLFLMTAILGIVSMFLLFGAVMANEEGYNFYVKLTVGGILTFVIGYCAILKISGLDVIQSVPEYGSVWAGLLLAGTVAFIIVNFLLDFQKGKVAVFVLLSELFFMCSVIRLWEYVKVTEGSPQYEKIMLISKIRDKLTSLFSDLGFASFTGIFEYILLIALMFVIGYYLFRTRAVIPGEWLGGVISQIMSGMAYLIYEAHDGIAWRADQAFLVFLLFCAGEMLYIFIFCYEIRCKSQDGCIGAFFIGLSGVLWHCAVVIAVDMTRRGAMSKSIERLSSLMTWIYEKIPFGMHTNFSQSNSFMALIGALIAIVLAVIIMIVLYLILGHVIDYESTGVGVSASWFRNCTMVLIIPVIICWVCSMYGNIFGSSYPWVSLAVQSLVSIGSALCISNIAPAFNEGFFGQLKLIAISAVCSLLAVCLLVPVCLSLI